jgi:SAM-dependent methyltransferase
MGEPSPESLIVAHYERYDEARRLERDIGPLEAARSRELMERFLPRAPAVVLDDGGAAGAYAFWLASLGYAVHLLDIVPRHIAQALEASRRPGSPALASARVGDARRLPFEAGQTDAVLLAGPLYHLAERDERLRALAEAHRVLRPGGVLLAFGITRYAGLVYGITQGLVFDPDYLRMISDEVRTGRRQNPPAGVLTLPSAHFHLPAELAGEVADAGFTVDAVLGVLGPAWLVPDLAAAWADAARREVLLEIARLSEAEPALGPRILVVGRK